MALVTYPESAGALTTATSDDAPAALAAPHRGKTKRQDAGPVYAGGTPTFIQVNARADAKPGEPAPASKRLRSKSEGDLLGKCAWEKCIKPKIVKDSQAMQAGLVLACNADCGGRVIHDACASELVDHYGSAEVSERLACDRCDGTISLRHYVWAWESWQNKLGAAWDLARTWSRNALRYGLVLLLVVTMLHRAIVFGGAYAGLQEVDRANNPQLGDSRALALLDFLSYRFVWKDLSVVGLYGNGSFVARSLDAMRCRLEGKCADEDRPSRQGRNRTCVAHWYPGFVLAPRQQLCELEHMAAGWIAILLVALAIRLAKRLGLGYALRLVGWALLVVFTFGFAHWAAGQWRQARRRRLNSVRSRRKQ